MKKSVLILVVILSVGLNVFVFGQKGQPFSPYLWWDYTVLQQAEIISNDSVLLSNYTNCFQHIAENDGWARFLPNHEVTQDTALYLIYNLTPSKESWKSGDLWIGERIGDEKTTFFHRPSYKDREKKIAGPEDVLVLDVTKLFGWTREDGSSYPVRIIQVRTCMNSVIDNRTIKVKKDRSRYYKITSYTPSIGGGTTATHIGTYRSVPYTPSIGGGNSAHIGTNGNGNYNPSNGGGNGAHVGQSSCNSSHPSNGGGNGSHIGTSCPTGYNSSNGGGMGNHVGKPCKTT